MAEARPSGCAGRLALILAILALAVAWAAYRREGGELRMLWRDLSRGSGGRVNITSDADADLRTWLAETRARLEKHRPEVAGERNLQQVREDVARARKNLERAYRNAGAGAKERWRSLDGDLERLEAQLKQGGSKALAALDEALAKLKKEAGREEDH